jgi:ATP adenylyltransferase/5',5'''-P-1,P-4-tetraphosphate phosphorylase II
MEATKIKRIDFVSEWKAPQGNVMKKCNVELENGIKGEVYIPEANYLKYTVGTSVNQSYNEKGKLKITLSEAVRTNTPKPMQNNTQQQHTITYYLGFAMGFAKDMAIEEFKKDPKAKEINTERFRALCKDAYAIAEELFNKNQ